MTTFALIHGAWGSGWHWGTVPAQLRALGHEVVAPNLPIEDPEATFEDYAAVVVDALAGAHDVVAVGFSLGGHTAAIVADRHPVRELVYLAAMVPEPGRSLHEQFARGDAMLLPEHRAGLARPDEHGVSRWVDFDVYYETTCHDCDEPVARERFARSRGQSNAPFRRPCPLDAMPQVPTRYISCSDERLMNNAYWRPVVRQRLRVEPVEIHASHSPMASVPDKLVRLLAPAPAATE